MHFQFICSYFLLLFISSTTMARYKERRNANVGSGGHPRISFISQSQTKDVGGIAYFSCHVTNPGNRTVTWLKVKNDWEGQNDTVIAKEGIVLVDPDRISANSKNPGNYFTLTVKNLRSSDTGTYRCQPTHNVGATTELFIRSLPVFCSEEKSDSVLAPVTLAEGSSHKLTCYAHGYPIPEILWSRNEAFTNNSIIGTGNVFNIRIANRKSTRGRYYCLAQNSLGMAKKSFDVRVSFLSRLIIPRPIFGATLHHDTYLECIANGYPAPNVTWFKGNKVIENDNHYRSNYVRIVNDDLTKATLHISSLELEHFGVYTCSVDNGIGSEAGKISVLQNVFKDYSAPLKLPGKSKAFPAPSVLNSAKAMEIDTPNPTPYHTTVKSHSENSGNSEDSVTENSGNSHKSAEGNSENTITESSGNSEKFEISVAEISEKPVAGDSEIYVTENSVIENVENSVIESVENLVTENPTTEHSATVTHYDLVFTTESS